MKETDRIIKLFEDLYSGDPWIDVSITATLQKITAKQAAKHVLPNCNSVWETVNHLIKWRLAVLDRLQEKQVVVPGNNYFEPVHDISPAAWETTLQQLAGSQQQWIGFLQIYKETEFEKLYNNRTSYENIQGIIQHDAYHLGQIVLLAKQFSGEQFNIKKATLSELEPLTELFDKYRVFYEKESDPASAKTFLTERITNNDSEIFVCSDGHGVLTGFVQLYPLFSSTRMKKLWLLNDLFVDEKFRGCGYSVALIDKAKELCISSHACGLMLETSKDNIVGNNLYPKTGFILEDHSNFYNWTPAATGTE